MDRIRKMIARGLAGVFFAAGALGASATPTVTYYHNDLAGSPVAATDASRNVIWRESYRPYGERLINSPASEPNDVWFTSRRQDAESGLVYMGARYYDPVVGRFYSTDPAGFAENNVHSFNRYAYANNNPNKYRDPTGRVAETIWDLASFAISVAIFKADPTVANFIGAAIDGAAVAVPFVPGGVGAIRAAGGAAKGATETAVRAVDDVAREAMPAIKAGAAGGETAGKSFPQAVREAAMAENPQSICVYCRREGVATQVDHAIPKARGGDATLEKPQLSCPHCNASKGARDYPVNPPSGYRGEWPPSHWGG